MRHGPLVEWAPLCPLLTVLPLLLPLGFALPFTQQEMRARRRLAWKASHPGLCLRQSAGALTLPFAQCLCFPSFFL